MDFKFFIVIKKRTRIVVGSDNCQSQALPPPPVIEHFGVSVLLKSHILHLILSGVLRQGMRLPTVREVSRDWNINRNTVSTVYQNLEEEGYLETRRGKGTVVASRGRAGMTENIADLLERLGAIVREGLALGLSREEIVGLAIGRAGEAGQEETCRLAVVECNREDLQQYRFELEKELNVRIKPILLSELRSPGVGRLTAGLSIVMTTFTHLFEVRAILSATDVTVVGLLAGNRLEDIIDLGKFPKGSRVAVVCVTREKARMLERKVRKGFAKMREVSILSIEETRDLIRALRPYEVVIVSKYAARMIPRKLPPFNKTIMYSNLCDREGVEMLRRIV